MIWPIAATGVLAADVPERGAYVAPVLFDNVDPDHVLAQQEIFGPVQTVLVFEDDEEAIHIANGTEYGFSSCRLDSRRQSANARGQSLESWPGIY